MFFSDRLSDLVARAGLLVFASHSDEFLRELCTSAIWMEHGQVKLQGSLKEVLTAYKGPEAWREKGSGAA